MIISLIPKLFSSIKKFGFKYNFFYILKKLYLINEIPIVLLIRRQNYYKNLSIENKKFELNNFYKNVTGKDIDFENPLSFTEKIQWLKFNDSTKIKADLSDKYFASNYISEKFPNKIKIVEQLGVWENANDIDFNKLPNKFVLKCTHGSAMNIIIKDKSKINIPKICKRLNDWLKVDYAYVNGMYENHYTYIKPRIIAEKFIEEANGNLHDYKFHCFMGEPKYIEFIGDRVPNTHVVHDSIYSIDWKLTDIRMNDDIPYKKEFTKPAKLPEMISLARILSNGFPYVRVDFYYINNEIYFGELTFTPDSGIIKFTPPEIDLEWGKLIDLAGKN